MRKGGRPQRTSRLAAGAAALVLLGALGALGPLGCERPGPGEDVAAAVPAEPAVEVEVTPVRRGSVGQTISVPGSLVARRESRIGAEVKGRIERIFVDEGDRVAEGDSLFQIDRSLYEVGVHEGEAQLRVAQAERRQVQSDLARAEKLRGKQIVSAQELGRLRTQLEVAGAREEQAERALARAQTDLEHTLVLAPYDGSVVGRLEDEGTTALVQPQTTVLVLQETSQLEARVAIPESQLSDVAVGDLALIHVEGMPRPFRARIASVGDAIDPATRTYLATMRVPNLEHQLKAGIFAHVEIVPEEKADVLVVPPEAIRREEGRTRVLAVRDGRAEAVPIEVGLVSKSGAEVLDGLDEGELVIVGEAARRIAPGLRVRAREDGAGGAAAP